MKAGLVLLLAAIAALFAFAACGGGSSSPSPATLAPPDSPLYVEAVVRPKGELQSNTEELSKKVTGIADPGAAIVSKLESALAEQGEKVSYAKDIEPWLGERAGIFFEHYDGANFSGLGAIVQSTNTGASKEFVEKLAGSSKTPVKSASYKGVEYKVDNSNGTSIGVIGSFLVFGQEEQAFKDAVSASQGESLAGADRYSSAIAAEPSESLANVYADIGSLLQQSGSQVSEQDLQVLKSLGLNLGDATAVASVLPASNHLEIDLSTNAAGADASTGSAASLLGSLPSGSLAAFAASGFGAQLRKAFDGLDASGVPPSLPPHELKATMAQAGLDLDKIAGSIEDAGVFAEGASRSSLGGALVLTTKSSADAGETVAKVGLLLRRAGTAGITAVSGKASGFSIHSPELGKNPLVVAAEGDRIAIGYGLPATLRGLSTESGQTLSGAPSYKEAVAALGPTPISGYVDGPAALRLADSLVPTSEQGFQEAKPYLAKIAYVAVGRGSSGELATAKLIVGFGK
ncbi:MAG: DUF3352 domain-containing protein [Solirubrobacterales bacterium]